MTTLSRRRFLTLTGAAAGLALLPSEFAELQQAVAESERQWPGPGVETWVNSVCQLCPGGCGIRVRLLDGWPVKISGNPDHPINQGGLCPKGEAGLQAFYDPDRIRRPLRRAGNRGEGRWQEIGWDEAIRMVAGKLRDLRTAGRPEALAVIGGQYRGLMRTMWDRFLTAFGSPNYISTAIGCETSDTVLFLTQGVRGQIAYDLENADYVLSFGVNLLEGSWSPVWQMRAYAHLRQGRSGRRPRIVQADVRFSMTAAKADEWLPLRPGTDGALALGLAHVLVRDGLYDLSFVRERSFGFDDWVGEDGRRHEGFRTMVLRDYAPSNVARVTGLPEQTIVRIAREFGQTRPALAMADRGVSRYPNGLHTRWAIHCLNALVASIDSRGGVLVPREIPLARLAPVSLDATAERGGHRPRVDGAGGTDAPLAASAIQRLPEAIRSGRPYPVEVALLYHANPVFSQSRSLRMDAALARVPFVVSFSPYHDESTQAADLVLPDHTFLERWQDDPTPRNVGFAVLGIRQPVRAPLYDTRSTSDVVLQIARALGDPLRRALPWTDTETFLKAQVKGVHDARRGMLASAVTAPWYDAFREVTRRAPASFDEFWRALLDRGAWWDPEYRFGDWDRTLRTRSGKFEFYSETLEAAIRRALGRPESPGTGREYLPHFEPVEPAGAGEQFPLTLNVFRPLAFTGGWTANMPYLLEVAGKSVRSSWESWVEINSVTARRFGIADRDWVWIESPLGRAKARARVHPGVPPDVVSLAYGLGHRAGGRWAAGLGANPNDLVGETTASITGGPAHAITRVKLSKA
jgi:anaerobic selenocysteine-containing dehydrogenase